MNYTPIQKKFIEKEAKHSLNNGNTARKALRHFNLAIIKSPEHEKRFLEYLKEINTEPKFYIILNEVVAKMIDGGLSPNSVKTYFNYLKKYLRSNALRIYNEDVKQFVNLPRLIREARVPLDKNQIATLCKNADDWLKTVILCLVSSGMREDELLQLKWSDLEWMGKRYRVKVRAETTLKTVMDRETYFSAQASAFVSQMKETSEGTYVFGNTYYSLRSLGQLETKFYRLRDRCSMLGKYRNSNVHHVTLHRLRAFCKTMASNINGKDYAEALIGHTDGMPTYYANPEEWRIKMYEKFESHVTIKL